MKKHKNYYPERDIVQRGSVSNLGPEVDQVADQVARGYRPRWASSSCRSDLLVPPAPVEFLTHLDSGRQDEGAQSLVLTAAWPLAWYLSALSLIQRHLWATGSAHTRLSSSSMAGYSDPSQPLLLDAWRLSEAPRTRSKAPRTREEKPGK